jgi:hypothetical protein
MGNFQLQNSYKHNREIWILNNLVVLLKSSLESCGFGKIFDLDMYQGII